MSYGRPKKRLAVLGCVRHRHIVAFRVSGSRRQGIIEWSAESSRSVASRVGRARRAQAARTRFRAFYPDGFQDPDFVDLERRYKVDAHRAWHLLLRRAEYARRLEAGDRHAIAQDVIRVESRTNLLFSFEKIALRDAVRPPAGAERFAEGLFDWLHGSGRPSTRFARWCRTVADLPREQTRVLTWPVLTTFGFIARPRVHMMLKPMVTRRAAREYGFDFRYSATPQWGTYESLLRFSRVIREDLTDWRPRDQIDIQSFIWVLGSDEYD